MQTIHFEDGVIICDTQTDKNVVITDQARYTTCQDCIDLLFDKLGVDDNEWLMQFFKYDHLPEKLQNASKPFTDIAKRIIVTLPRNPERTVALRKLLEAKDAAVRCKLTS